METGEIIRQHGRHRYTAEKWEEKKARERRRYREKYPSGRRNKRGAFRKLPYNGIELHDMVVRLLAMKWVD